MTNKTKNGLFPYRELNPVWNSIGQFEEEVNKFFKNPFFTTYESKRALPKINIKEKEDKYIVEAFLAGYDKKDVTVNVENNHLTISSKKHAIFLDADEHYVHKEISGRSFSRTIPFVHEVREDNVKAKFKEGILSITLLKVIPTKSKVKKIIEVKVE
tara:strand:+ start:119 stop:589 length:471 start_codon:yes stop_codon:yes gene_type:complete